MSFIVLDIETIPCQTLPPECVPRLDEADVKLGNLKDPAKVAEKLAEARATFGAGRDKAMSCDPDLCSVCCACVGLYGFHEDYGTVIEHDMVTHIAGPDGFEADDAEVDIVADTWNLIDRRIKAGDWLVSFNGARFDLPILYRRAMYLDVVVDPCLYETLTRPFARKHVDLMDRLGRRNPFTGKMEYKPLSFYLARFGLGGKTNGMDGSMVYPAWREGRIDEIAAYCAQDVRATAELYDAVRAYLPDPLEKDKA